MVFYRFSVFGSSEKGVFIGKLDLVDFFTGFMVWQIGIGRTTISSNCMVCMAFAIVSYIDLFDEYPTSSGFFPRSMVI